MLTVFDVFGLQLKNWYNCDLKRINMEQLPKCPECGSEYTYEDGELYVCPECGHEWSKDSAVAAEEEGGAVVRDANGNILQDGDTVTVIKDLKVKGASSDIKVGTKVKNIKLKPDSDHNIDCKIPGVGAMGLKSEFVKKV
jgi:protein PhnA